jgi:hypothetical protein
MWTQTGSDYQCSRNDHTVVPCRADMVFSLELHHLLGFMNSYMGCFKFTIRPLRTSVMFAVVHEVTTGMREWKEIARCRKWNL